MTNLANGAWGRRTVADQARDLPADSKFKRAGRNRLLIDYPNGRRAYRFHLTDVVTVDSDGTVVLSDGGFPTRTTREAFNEGLNALTKIGKRVGSGGKISNHSLGWGEGAIAFEHELTLAPDGSLIETDAKPSELKRRKKLKKKITKFAASVHDVDKLPAPSSGDCFFCQWQADGESLGDATGDHSHLQSHIDESYLHGSLIINALRARGYTDAGLSLFWHDANSDNEWRRKHGRQRIAQALQRYLSKKLGLAV